MSTVTLQAKAYNNFQLKLVDKLLKSKVRGLNVKTEICGITPRRWVQITISGEDERVALCYLADEIGLCPTHLEEIEKFSTSKGYITKMEKSKDELNLDIGVFSPENISTTISLQHLQTQLVDGRKVAFKKLAELFGFSENLPLNVKILNIYRDAGHVEAALSEKQLTQFGNWTKSLLDRLIVLGSSIYEVRLALRKAGLDRDVLSVEPLGLFEFAVACKLGTDAAGLIPKIGKSLRGATIAVFSPKRLLEFSDYSSASISHD
jgi:hypothetical protein